MNHLSIIFVNTNTLSLDSLLSSSFLSDDNLFEINHYKVEESKKEKACSFILKNKYVKEYLVNEFGKPISENCFFNVSHSHGVVVFVKSDTPIGIDIEKIRPVKEDLIDYISSYEEKEYIKDDKTFFEVWTNKEAIVKSIGTGINCKISDIPSLPINSIRKFKDKVFYSKTIIYLDYVITVSKVGDTPFEIEISEERV